MIVSSWNLDNESNYNLDVFDLNTCCIVKTLKLSNMFNRIISISKDLLYAVDRNCKDSYVYVISLSS